MYKLTYLEALFSTFLWLVMFLKYKPAMQLRNQSRGNYKFFLILLVVFSTFGFCSGDFFHYYKSYEDSYRIGKGYFEPFYNYLTINLPYGYYYWRFVIWGLSAYILTQTFRRLNLPPNLSCFIFVIILLSYFPNPRNTLGYVVLYYSITFFVKPLDKKSLSYLIGVTGIILSLSLHKSMPLYIGISLLSFFPLKKWMYKMSLCIFPILYGAFYKISSYFLSLGDSKTFHDVGTMYLEDENFAIVNIFGSIQLLIERIPLVVLIYISISAILKKEIKDNATIVFCRNTYWLMYISCLFFNQPTSSFLSGRFWDASVFPLAIALPVALYNRKSKVIMYCFYILSLGTFLYKFIYPIYKV